MQKLKDIMKKMVSVFLVSNNLKIHNIDNSLQIKLKSKLDI